MFRLLQPHLLRMIFLSLIGIGLFNCTSTTTISPKSDPLKTIPESSSLEKEAEAIPSDSSSRYILQTLPNKPHLRKTLVSFHRSLKHLGHRQQVNILQLGDSHTANDKFSGHLRHLFQRRFGAAGRGMLPVGEPFSYFRPTQVHVSQSQGWEVSNSQKMPFSNPYGLSGFRIKSSNPNHFIKLSMTDGSRFDEIHLEFLRHFRAGTLLVKIDKAKPIEVKTQAFSQYVDIEKITRHGRRVRIAPKGDGPIELLSWTFKRNQTGIIYHSHGIVGATINVIKRWNQEVVFYELKKLLKPSLILVAYGTNEGFHDDLNMRKYTRDFQARLALLRRAAPRASIVVIGPPDANRLPSFCHQRRNRNCSPLTSNERKHYQQLLARRDQRLCRWHPPPKLAAVRDIQRYVANKEGYFFWDWSQIMGGQCGIHTWTNHKLAYKDHIHLTKSGYQRSADALFAVINR